VNEKRLSGLSLVAKRSIVNGGHQTSVSLKYRYITFEARHGDRQRSHPREHANLSSAIRLFVLDHYRRIAEFKRMEP
jgi:predicted DNA-binding ribbon-helix-helix protein